ncbi:hypothetical protein Tco_0824644 [Tanacetum coccineum]|uniref:Uncharacterized protein n=1 Tax=Tanacetum coccineum TaxID=301880 RepID=A0ABQ5ALB1_9ASTR
MNTRLNIEKLDGNIVQKHEGSKQVGFKQLGPGVETGVHGVHDEKRVWFEVELQGAQGDREAEVFQVSNDDTAVAQRRFGDRATEEKTNTDRLGPTQQLYAEVVFSKHLGVAVIQQQNGLIFWAEDTTMSTHLVTRSPSSAIGFKTPIDMLGFFGWLASIKQGVLEPVKVKCIFLGYRKVVGNKALKGATLCMGTIQYREDSNETAFAVAAVGKIYAHESLTFNNTVACEVTTAMAITGSLHQSRIHNEKLVQTLLKGHSILSLEGSLSGDYDVEKNDVQVFVDFDYAMGRSITSGVYDTYWGLEEGNMAKGTFGRVRI